jgi:3-methyladenine DNA glycosylase AlkC
MMMSQKTLMDTLEQLDPSGLDHFIELALKLKRSKDRIRDLEELKVTYPDQWIALAISEGEDRYEPKRGYLIAHSPHREEVWAIVNALPSDKNVYVFFNGTVTAKGFSITFYDTEDKPEVASVGR